MEKDDKYVLLRDRIIAILQEELSERPYYGIALLVELVIDGSRAPLVEEDEEGEFCNELVLGRRVNLDYYFHDLMDKALYQSRYDMEEVYSEFYEMEEDEDFSVGLYIYDEIYKDPFVWSMLATYSLDVFTTYSDYICVRLKLYGRKCDGLSAVAIYKNTVKRLFTYHKQLSQKALEEARRGIYEKR